MISVKCSFLKLNLIKRIFNVNHRFCSRAVDVNTNVVKDVILFKYDNPKFFKILNIFAICQFGFWTYLSTFAYKGLRDVPPAKKSEDVAWWRKINLGESKYRNTIAISAFVIGYGILTISWMFTLKSIRYLILRKGGKQVTLVTYTPYGKNRMMTINLENFSSKETREKVTSQLPIKVKGHYFHYILDMKGEFKNTALFDNTVGLQRKWNMKK